MFQKKLRRKTHQQQLQLHSFLWNTLYAESVGVRNLYDEKILNLQVQLWQIVPVHATYYIFTYYLINDTIFGETNYWT
jgi:hypothetical protein